MRREHLDVELAAAADIGADPVDQPHALQLAAADAAGALEPKQRKEKARSTSARRRPCGWRRGGRTARRDVLLEVVHLEAGPPIEKARSSSEPFEHHRPAVHHRRRQRRSPPGAHSRRGGAVQEIVDVLPQAGVELPPVCGKPFVATSRVGATALKQSFAGSS